MLGGAIGLVVAFLLFGVAASLLPSFPIVFAPDLVVIAFVISVLTGVVSGFAPAWQAARLHPIEALRYE